MSETVTDFTVSINNLKSLSIHTIRVVQRLAEGSWLRVIAELFPGILQCISHPGEEVSFSHLVNVAGVSQGIQDLVLRYTENVPCISLLFPSRGIGGGQPLNRMVTSVTSSRRRTGTAPRM